MVYIIMLYMLYPAPELQINYTTSGPMAILFYGKTFYTLVAAIVVVVGFSNIAATANGKY